MTAAPVSGAMAATMKARSQPGDLGFAFDRTNERDDPAHEASWQGPLTKTAIRYSVHLPPEVMDVLRWHVESLSVVQERSDLLFPSETGGFRAGSSLKKPFQDVVDAMQLGFKLTPRGMRRTFQDLARAAEVQDLVTRSVSGHATAEMQRHYSTGLLSLGSGSVQ